MRNFTSALASILLATLTSAAALADTAQEAYLKASNPGPNDVFGEAVAISGDTLVIGARKEDSGATGVNGNQLDNSQGGAGAVYVFVRSGNTWTQQAYLKASNAWQDDFFGQSVAISGDTLVVGAPGEDSAAIGVNGDQADNSLIRPGAAYVFMRNGTTWTQQAYLKASNPDSFDEFGSTVSIDGDTIVVGCTGESSNATGVNGGQSDNSSTRSGAAYVFVRNGTTWAQAAYLKASNGGFDDQFGWAVAVNGDTLAVGARQEDSSSAGINSGPSDDSANNAGAAYVFVRNGTTWSQEAYVKASNSRVGSHFGTAVAISNQTLVVSADTEAGGATGVNGDESDVSGPGSGAAYVFVRNGTSWTQQAYLKASNTDSSDLFGSAVSISGERIVVGAANERSSATGIDGDQDNDEVTGAGAGYVFERDGSTWSQAAYLKASNTESSGALSTDYFGFRVGLSGDTLVVGGPFEDSSSAGVNGDQTNNGLASAGAAYVFDFNAAAIGTAFCFDDGFGAVCPCGLPSGPGVGCVNSTGLGAVLSACGSASVSANNSVFLATHLPAKQPVLLRSADSWIAGGAGTPFGDGLLCISTNTVRLGVMFADANGEALWGSIDALAGGWSAGDTRYFQAWYRDPLGGPCGNGFNQTNGLTLSFVP